MTMNHLPPQAYTKETMSKAFQWLQTQAPQIREIATTPDILVSLYQKAQMHGEEALERPSIQNFKNELKSLAGMMGELQGPKNSAQTSVSNQSVTAAASTPQMTLSQNVQPTPSSSVPPTTSTSTTSSLNTTTNTFDSRSWAMIQEVKNELNLSSENEALRMLISLGYSKAKTILSK